MSTASDRRWRKTTDAGRPTPKYPKRIRSFFNIVEWMDEWVHEHGRGRMTRSGVPWWFKPVCDWRERQYHREQS